MSRSCRVMSAPRPLPKVAWQPLQPLPGVPPFQHFRQLQYSDFNVSSLPWGKLRLYTLCTISSQAIGCLAGRACHVEARGQGCHVMNPRSEVWCRYEQAAAPAELVMQGQEPARLLNALQALQQQLGSQVSLVGECSALSPLLQVRSLSCESCMHALQLACWHAASKCWSRSAWAVWRCAGRLSRKRGGASLQLSYTPRRC